MYRRKVKYDKIFLDASRFLFRMSRERERKKYEFLVVYVRERIKGVTFGVGKELSNHDNLTSIFLYLFIFYFKVFSSSFPIKRYLKTFFLPSLYVFL